MENVGNVGICQNCLIKRQRTIRKNLFNVPVWQFIICMNFFIRPFLIILFMHLIIMIITRNVRLKIAGGTSKMRS